MPMVDIDPVKTAPVPGRVWLALLLNALLWTAGHALTSGGFLSYLVYELKPAPVQMALFLATPETVGSLAVLSGRVFPPLGGRKFAYLWCTLIGRAVMIGIPLLAAGRMGSEGGAAMWLVIGLLAVSHVLQAISSVALLSWIGDLVPAATWGRLLGWRHVASVVSLLGMTGVGFARDQGKAAWTAAQLHSFYLGCFGLGLGLVLLSVVPLLFLRDQGAWRETPHMAGNLRAALRVPRLRRFLLFSWALAFWSGLTQAAFFKFRIEVLAVGLGTFYLLEGVMRSVQLPVSAIAGQAVDRGRLRAPLTFGVLATGTSLALWCIAIRETWWLLWLNAILWGGWGAINVAGPAAALRYSPPSLTDASVGLFHALSGLCAGLAGVLGGQLLSGLLEQQSLVVFTGDRYTAFRILFLISLVGRLSTLMLLARLPPPPPLEVASRGSPTDTAAEDSPDASSAAAKPRERRGSVAEGRPGD